MRALLALAVIAAAVAAGAFLADHPGRVAIVWQGWQIDTSTGVLAGAAALLGLAAAALALIVAALWRLPRAVGRRRAARRRRAGERALTGGIVALAAGQPAEALRQARRAGALLEGALVPALLVAEAATRQGDTATARQAYTALLDRKESEFLGLRGLIGQALRAGDDATALRLAERARRLHPEAPWLADSLLVLEARAGNWEAARDTLAAAARHGLLPIAEARHHRAVVLYELSRGAERAGRLRAAAGLAAKAQALAPDLAPLSCHHARLLAELGRRRAAAKAIERAWRAAPHPDLAHLYCDLDRDAAPLARAAAVQRLAEHNPGAAESHLAAAEAALAAELWGEARRHLAALAPPTVAPSRRLCRLMARLEEGEGGNATAARAWLDRALALPPDPTYVCRRCAGESGEWRPLCPHCGGFDALAWERPPVHPRPQPAALPGAPSLLPAPEVLPPPSGLANPPQCDK
jgi:HemY protein